MLQIRFDGGRYYPDVDRERWDMCFLGKLLKNIGVCKKYLRNDGIYTSIQYCCKICRRVFKTYILILSGYMISKDVMTMAMNLNDGFRKCVDKLFFNKQTYQKQFKIRFLSLKKA